MPHASRTLLALAFGGLCVAASAADLSTLTGKKYVGDLGSINDGVLTIRTEAGPIGVAVKDVFLVDFGHPVAAPAKYDEIELIDGSLVRCGGFKVKGKEVLPAFTAGKASPPKATIPLDNLFAVLRNGDDAKNREEWRKVLGNRGKRDLFVIKQADGFSPIPGTVLGGDDTGDAIDFERESDGQKVTFKLSRASGGLVFNQPPRGVIPPTLCKVHDVFGNTLTAQTVVTTKTGLTVTTVSGAKFEYDTLAAVSKLDFSQGNVAYLSEFADKDLVSLQPVAADKSANEFPYAYLRDKTPTTFKTGGFRLGGVSYAKGLWLARDAVLVAKLGGNFREFKAIVGVDDEVPLSSSAVKLTIEADGRPVFAETVSRKDKPRTLNLDVKGVKELTVRVEPVGEFQANEVNLAEARVQK